MLQKIFNREASLIFFCELFLHLISNTKHYELLFPCMSNKVRSFYFCCLVRNYMGNIREVPFRFFIASSSDVVHLNLHNASYRLQTSTILDKPGHKFRVVMRTIEGPKLSS